MLADLAVVVVMVVGGLWRLLHFECRVLCGGFSCQFRQWRIWWITGGVVLVEADFAEAVAVVEAEVEVGGS